MPRAGIARRRIRGESTAGDIARFPARRARRRERRAVRAAHFQASGNGDCASSRAIGVLGAPSPGAMRRAVGSDAPAADAADAAGSVVAKGVSVSTVTM
ncbi:hypothetical protein BMA0844 [Burkholderia mallei ATCC 23344]|uniref:Uncharacterized protein n=1 Tax=Burkholderia mallei (strain ATCC 23344) TaxID=243160 RepID=A0A0H2WJK5_BURMA|nr:hypothetical protein BMA0844 [Burkholderia mallei ATCC 23344]